MRRIALSPSFGTSSRSTWWLTTLLCLTVAAGTTACRAEQERADQQPTADSQEAQNVQVSEITDQPDQYTGRRVRAESTVQQVVSDRGLFIGDSPEQRLFITVLGPKELMPDLEERQRVRVTGQVAARDRIAQQVGNQLDEDTREELQHHRHALVVGVDEIQVVEQAPEPQVTEVEFSEVVSDPQTYADQHIRGETSVQEVVDDQGAYLGEASGNRLVALVRDADDPPAQVDFKPRQRIRIQGEVMASDQAEAELDDQLSSELRLRLREQGYALVADPQNVEILEQAPETTVRIGNNDYGTFSDWDQDDDQSLSHNEFMTQITERNVMSDLSSDPDRSTLDQGEFRSWLMATLDPNDDDALNQREFQAATKSWRNVQWGLFEDWNTDGDDQLTTSEFESGLEQVGLFDQWDADGNGEIGSDEFADSLFGVWDRDGDGNLAPAEIGIGEPDEAPQPEARR